MAQTTGPVLAIGGLTLANRVIFNDRPMDWKVPIATGISAVLFAGAERVIGRGAVALAYLALVSVVFVRVDPATPSPAESALKWFNER